MWTLAVVVASVRVVVEPDGSVSAEPSAIPKRLFLTSQFASADKLPENVRKNVEHTKKLHADYQITWFDDAACMAYLQKHQPNRTRHFETLKHSEGKFRSDFCRAAVLFDQGGFYVDLDLELAMPLHEMVNRDTDFMSAWCENEQDGILNAIMGTTAHNPIMEETLTVMEGSLPGDKDYKANWGPRTLWRGFKIATEKCGGTLAVKSDGEGPDYKVCDQNVRLFDEVNMIHGATRERVDARSLLSAFMHSVKEERNLAFSGAQYAIFCVHPHRAVIPAAGKSDRFNKFTHPKSPADFLVAFSRFNECGDWGCDQANGGGGSDTEGPDAEATLRQHAETREKGGDQSLRKHGDVGS